VLLEVPPPVMAAVLLGVLPLLPAQLRVCRCGSGRFETHLVLLVPGSTALGARQAGTVPGEEVPTAALFDVSPCGDVKSDESYDTPYAYGTRIGAGRLPGQAGPCNCRVG
jgi:hypothetical protein